MINDYERRFQRSVEKLPIPSWFQIDPKISSNCQSPSKQSVFWNGPMMEVKNRQTRTYRSCRSSLATSRSPSVHSWHPNILVDRLNSNSRNISRSSSRRTEKYEKGAERVSKSSQWYRPTTFVLPGKSNSKEKDQNCVEPLKTVENVNQHYDIPKFSSICRSSMVEIDEFASNHKTELIEMNKEFFSKNSTLIEKKIPSIEMKFDESKDFQKMVDEKNFGVRELSDDEDDLRELDENEINGTDEFFVFASDFDDRRSLSTSNRLYTFSKFNDQNNRNSLEIGKNSPTMNFPLFDSLSEDKSIETLVHRSSAGVDEETVRIGRLLLQSIPNQCQIKNSSNFDQRSMIEEANFPVENDDEYLEDVHHDSGYSSNHERFPLSNGDYEHLFDCLSGFSCGVTDFPPVNFSSMTDEAYESEGTTMSSSIRTNVLSRNVHPHLENEFEISNEPPPIPDRRLKPEHFRPSTKLSKNQVEPSNLEKRKSIPKKLVEQFLGTTVNDFSSKPVKFIDSRVYCGSIPISKENFSLQIQENPTIKTRPAKTKRQNQTLNCLNSTVDEDEQKNCSTWIKSSTSPSNKNKTRKSSKNSIDELTNGLAIRFTAQKTTKSNVEKKSTRKYDQNSEVQLTTQLPVYETSV